VTGNIASIGLSLRRFLVRSVVLFNKGVHAEAQSAQRKREVFSPAFSASLREAKKLIG
jgi:hypothetical protein